MLISKKWLHDFVSLPDNVSASQLADCLTMHTVEIEGVQEQVKEFYNIVVGVIQTVLPHENANRLRVCGIDIGESEIVQIVCGGSNLQEGQKVVIAKVGSSVKWHGEGQPTILEKIKIRGVDSYGMICASSEVGLEDYYPTEDEREIIDLGDIDAPAGMNIGEALGLDDTIFDVDNKSMTHRPDLWGQYGIAREISALYKQPLKQYHPASIPQVSVDKQQLHVDVQDTEFCRRYMGVIIDGIVVEQSPTWLRQRLFAVGLSPINNIVDITNFVMMEIGQPMHAFDKAQLTVDKDVQIIIRKAKKGEKFTLLNGKKYILTSDMFVIGDGKKAVAIAGIMGGKNSEISNKTKTIIFESANFNPISVRKTAVALGIRTDSSTRFEKSLDSVNTELALKRAVELTLQLCPNAHVVSDIVDVKQKQQIPKQIVVPLDFLASKIGVHVDIKVILDILHRLGFGVKEKKDILYVDVPSWRATKDISIPEDIVEEVARMYGYDIIGMSLPVASIAPPIDNTLRELQRRAKIMLAYEYAYTEVYNYSFESPEWLQQIGIDTSKHIELDNPIAKDRKLLRRQLMPNLLENVEKNSHRFEVVRLFEIGKVFLTEQSGELARDDGGVCLPRQDTHLAIVSATKDVDVPFYDVSHVCITLCKQLSISVFVKDVGVPDISFFHAGRYANIMVGDVCIGYIAEIHPATQKVLGIPYRTAVAEINLNILVNHISDNSCYRSVPSFPAVERDVAFIVDLSVHHADIVLAIENVDSLVESVVLFDVYEGKAVPKQKKSMAYHIVYRAQDKTLTSEDAQKIHSKVIKILEKKFKARVRV